MNHRGTKIAAYCLTATVMLLGATERYSWAAAPQASSEAGAPTPWEVGTRITGIILTEDHRGAPFNNSFVGTITELKPSQDYWPDKLYVQYRFLPAFAVGLSYDRFGVEAWDDSGTDGTIWSDGPMAYLSGRYQNDTIFTPYGELGVAYYFVKFHHATGWGDSDNKDFYLNNTHAFYAALGCEAKIDDYWSADLYGRYMHMDVTGNYNLNGHKEDDIIFTMAHIALGVGVKYTF